MNVLDLLKARIIEQFPNITQEELSIRMKIAQELLHGIKK